MRRHFTKAAIFHKDMTWSMTLLTADGASAHVLLMQKLSIVVSALGGQEHYDISQMRLQKNLKKLKIVKCVSVVKP